jgi:hypothetical protein
MGQRTLTRAHVSNLCWKWRKEKGNIFVPSHLASISKAPRKGLITRARALSASLRDEAIGRLAVPVSSPCDLRPFNEGADYNRVPPQVNNSLQALQFPLFAAKTLSRRSCAC